MTGRGFIFPCDALTMPMIIRASGASQSRPKIVVMMLKTAHEPVAIKTAVKMAMSIEYAMENAADAIANTVP